MWAPQNSGGGGFKLGGTIIFTGAEGWGLTQVCHNPLVSSSSVPLPALPPTQSSETGTDQGLRWHNLPREGNGVWGGGWAMRGEGGH